MTDRERKALLYFAYRVRGGRAWYWQLWWEAIDLLPHPQDMPQSWWHWAHIAESLATEERPISSCSQERPEIR